MDTEFPSPDIYLPSLGKKKQNSTWFYFHTVNDTFQAISKDVSYGSMIHGHDLEDRSFIWLVWGGRSCLEKINRTSRLLGEKGNQTFCSVEVFIKLLKLPFHHNQLTIITIMSAEIFIKLLKLSFPDRLNCIINAKKDDGVIFFQRWKYSGGCSDQGVVMTQTLSQLQMCGLSSMFQCIVNCMA